MTHEHLAPVARRPDDGAPDDAGLVALADSVGIVREYVEIDGTRHPTSDAARAAILAAMGFDVADEQAVVRAVASRREALMARLLPPARVVPLAELDGGLAVALWRPAARGRPLAWTVRLALEDGSERRADGADLVDEEGMLRVRVPAPPLGYHRLAVALEDGAAGEQALVVVPDACPSPAEALGGERAVGLTVNLYTVRSARNWGVGDLTDLRALVELAAAQGMAFVGCNPLHALRNAGGDISPYSPVSRRFRNVLYLDVADLPELAAAPEASALLGDPALHARLAELRAAAHVDYEGVMACKRPLLEAAHRALRTLPADDPRRAGYEAWAAGEGEALDRFATFCALDEALRPEGAGWWREWPEALQDPRSPAVAAFREAHVEAVDFHRWCQYAVDRQLGAVQARARALGMPVGLYQDLAIGASPASADVWSEPELFLRGVSIGAPPDPLGPEGQNWGLPPMDPRRLAERGYAPWAALLRAAMRHAGALRMDHVLGLFRQFWIPEGMRGAEGTYIGFPVDDLLGIVALEAARAGALVVGEDLGTVPPEVPPTMQRWGLLSSKVLYFERGEGGSFRPPRGYPRMALATVNTHDLAPLAGWWGGRDLALRRAVGQAPEDDAGRAEAERAHERGELLGLLHAEGLLDEATCEAARRDPAAVDEARIRGAVHALVRRTPSWLVGLSLDDVVGETEPVNLPGVGGDRFPVWSRRLSVPLEALRDAPGLAHALGVERARPGGAG